MKHDWMERSFEHQWLVCQRCRRTDLACLALGKRQCDGPRRPAEQPKHTQDAGASSLRLKAGQL